MKGITEERLEQILRVSSDSHLRNALINLLDECQEIDTLIVSKLRPMVDAKEGEQILAFKINEKVFLNICCPDITDEFCKAFSGWIPMPIYKPELIGEVE